MSEPQFIDAGLSEPSTVALERVMGTAEGRRLFFELLSALGMYRNPMSADPHTTAFHCGRQSAAQYLQSVMTIAHPEHVFTMMAEAAVREQEREMAQRNARHEEIHHAS